MATRFTPKTAAELKRGDAVELTVLPATVLAPLSVTAEQVEAGKDAMRGTDAWLSIAAASRMTQADSVRFRAELVTAALAAMGIPVVDGE